MTSDGQDPRDKQRWQPKGDADWAFATRQTMFDPVRRCIASEITATLPRDASPDELYAADEVFRHLYECTGSCARSLQAIGQDAEGVVRIVRAAANEAAMPDTLHPAVIRAIERWCRDACGG